jgi:putative ABC transport system permease protein
VEQAGSLNVTCRDLSSPANVSGVLDVLNRMWSDLKFAARSLRATPGFTTVALVVLTLGIGATTAIFSIVDAVALRGMPFERADRLMVVEETTPSTSVMGGGYVAAPNFYDWRAQQTSFEDLAAFQSKGFVLHAPGEEPAILRTYMVSASLMPLLRARPIRGALFTVQHEVAGANRVALISWRLWQTRYGGDPAIVGKTFTVGDRAAAGKGEGDNGPWQIIGVMPEEFEFPVGRLRPVDVWVPYVPAAYEHPRGDGKARNYNAQVIGRLKDGVSREQALAEMARITAGLAAEHPLWFRDGRSVGVVPLKDAVVGRARGWMFLLLGSVAFVLLIACVNVANLMLARSTARARDIGVRAALGATRWQLARGLLAESLLLSMTGTLLSLGLAYGGIAVLRASLPGTLPRLATATLDLRVLGLAAFAAVITGIAFGLLPALRLSRPRLAGALREGGRSGQAGQAKERARSLLLVAEVALAAVLLIGAGLFVSSFVKLVQVNLGARIENVITMWVAPPIDFQSPDLVAQRVRAAILIEEVFERVKALPGVERAAFIGNGSVPLGPGWSRTVFEIPGVARFEDPADIPDTKSISPDYFAVLGIEVMQGRPFNEADRNDGAPAVTIINDIAAQRFFKGQNPVGQRVKANGERTIVGVVRAVRVSGPEAELRPEVYSPASRSNAFGATMLVRTHDVDGVAPRVRAVVREVLPNVIVPQPETLETLYGRLVAQRKFNMLVLALFGVLAIVIAAVGIYGVMACLVEQRTQEIGIRMALGARPEQVMRMVLSRTAALMAAGIAMGLTGGWMLSRFVAAFLFRVEPHDALVYLAAALVLVLAGLVAAYLPARRASRIDPMLVLK